MLWKRHKSLEESGDNEVLNFVAKILRKRSFPGYMWADLSVPYQQRPIQSCVKQLQSDL